MSIIEEYSDQIEHFQNSTDYKHSYLFFFEKKYFQHDYVKLKHDWIDKNWKLCFTYSFLYVFLIFIGQRLMKNREKFHLYRPLIAWNLVLAIFSFLGAIRTVPHFIHILRYKGIVHSVCVYDFVYGVSGCWAWLFILSKVAELIDTLFIVLRKQKLIFLHWYHHASVLIYCWFSTQSDNAPGRWFFVMNYTIHSVMYGYYALRALRFKIPRWVNICITSGQISQMVVGLFVNILAVYKKNRGEKCEVSYENIYWSFIMYFTYFLLFFHFFINAYFTKSITSTKTNHNQSDSTQKQVKKQN